MLSNKITINRVWAMPNKNTFAIKPIKEFVHKYLAASHISIDPFANNCNFATHTNDLNPNTTAQYHIKSDAFLQMLIDKGIKADLIIFDPPYSLRQIKECYQSIGKLKFEQTEAQNAIRWTIEKELCNKLLIPNGIFLHFGWHSNGMGKKYGCRIEEILLVAHGGAHNDTICMAERKIYQIKK